MLAAGRDRIRALGRWLRYHVRLRTRLRKLGRRLRVVCRPRKAARTSSSAATTPGKATGRVINEHFVPEAGVSLMDYLARGHRTAVHHLVRYEWAEAVLGEVGRVDRLLDIACGAGYGSHALANRFPEAEVVGADYDLGAVEFARATYEAPNLSFVHADVTRWKESLGVEAFDCVVSFDTIEHVAHREIMLQNVVDHMHPNGLLLLSTPVRSENVLNPGWEHHKIEFSRSALYDFLSRYFREILAPELGTLPQADAFAEINAEEPVYSLRMNPVVCRKPITVSLPP